jgi:hypothetical protein
VFTGKWRQGGSPERLKTIRRGRDFSVTSLDLLKACPYSILKGDDEHVYPTWFLTSLVIAGH